MQNYKKINRNLVFHEGDGNKRITKENKTRVYVMWHCGSLLSSYILQSLFIISFSSQINSNLIFTYYSCNYQLFSSLTHVDLQILFFFFIYVVKDITKYLKEICSKSSQNCKELSL